MTDGEGFQFWIQQLSRSLALLHAKISSFCNRATHTHTYTQTNNGKYSFLWHSYAFCIDILLGWNTILCTENIFVLFICWMHEIATICCCYNWRGRRDDDVATCIHECGVRIVPSIVHLLSMCVCVFTCVCMFLSLVLPIIMIQLTLFNDPFAQHLSARPILFWEHCEMRETQSTKATQAIIFYLYSLCVSWSQWLETFIDSYIVKVWVCFFSVISYPKQIPDNFTSIPPNSIP